MVAEPRSPKGGIASLVKASSEGHCPKRYGEIKICWIFSGRMLLPCRSERRWGYKRRPQTHATTGSFRLLANRNWYCLRLNMGTAEASATPVAAPWVICYSVLARWWMV